MRRFDPRPGLLPGVRLLAAAALLATACSETSVSPPSGSDDEGPEAPLPGLVVTEPQTVTPGAAGAITPLSAVLTDGTGFAYVSAEPGTLPGAVSVRIRNLTRGDTALSAVPVRDGGFDPVGVPADPGDELELAILQSNEETRRVTLIVPPRRPPTVVRTNPPRGRTDVAASVQPVIVFSEPMDPESLTRTSVQLLGDGVPVVASVTLVDGSPFTVALTPQSMLQPSTDYELVVTTGVRDLDGDALDEELRVDFRTVGAGGLAMAAVSGDDQPGRAGRELPEPFVVRVTNAQGVGVANAEVTWSVTSGEGVLDGRWSTCFTEYASDGTVLYQALDQPIVTTGVSTDGEGFSRVSFMPTWFGPVTVTAAIPELPASTVTFSTDATDPGATLAIVSGNFQEGVAAPFFDGEPFVVRVTDGQGEAVPHVAVAWSVVSGDGVLSPPTGCPYADEHAVTAVTRTEAKDEGVPGAAVDFRPRRLGGSSVAATVAGIQQPPVVFAVEATSVLVGLCSHPVHDGEFVFCGPHGTSDVSVPVGAEVEFRGGPETTHIKSTSAPPGGDAIDSGPLSWPDGFRFVPEVAGTWELVDAVSGAVGTLTALAEDDSDVSGWGALVVSNVTTGGAFDVDGYQVRITAPPHPPRTVSLELNRQVQVAGLPAGPATVELEGVAANCSVSGSSSRSVAVPAGGEARLELQATCTPPPELASLRLVFSKWDKYAPAGEIFHLWSMNADGSDPRQLTSGPVSDAGPIPSPDGTRIAFGRDPAGWGFWGVYYSYTVGVHGGEVTPLPSDSRAASWSPDGTRILLDGVNIDVIDADGTGRWTLVGSGGETGQPAWSPDGETIVFYRHVPPGGPSTCANPRTGDEIWAIDADGRNERLLKALGPCGDRSHLSWTASGRILFTYKDTPDAPPTMWRMNADGSNAARFLGAPPLGMPFGRISPDGLWMTTMRSYSTPEWGIDVYLWSLEYGTLFRVTADGVSFGAAVLP